MEGRSKVGLQMADLSGTASSQNNDNQQKDSGMAELDVKLDTKIKMNFENLVKVDEKLQQLIDILKQNKTANISQLCSDWWELTDEEDYTIAKFEKALIKDENQ
jgi:hypothetical protein